MTNQQLGLVILIASITAVFFALYELALPKPVPGIPFNKKSSRQILGDIPALLSHIKAENGTFVTYITGTVQRLNAPLVQVFLRPMSSPSLILADFREAHDIMTRRKDFDRSPSTGDVARALAPNHHVHLKTNAVWKAQRRLIQDLMSPDFLQTVAGPKMHQSAKVMVELWRQKCRIADGRPWEAGDDISHVSLDAVMGFSFGERFGHGATRPKLDAMNSGTPTSFRSSTVSGNQDTPFQFPNIELDEVLQAMLNVAKIIKDIQSSALPVLKWFYILNQPQNKKSMKVKEDFIIERLTETALSIDKSVIESGVDHMVKQERALARIAHREPEYVSRVMIDEVFGFVIAGHDTTGTTISWALKHLADCSQAQTKLRNELRQTLSVAGAECRDPRLDEIVNSHLPYLDAVMEEVLRCCGTGVIVDRQALVETEVLGHRIPKGTVVTCMITGPGLTSPPIQVEEKHDGPIRNTKLKNWDIEGIELFKPERWLVQDKATGQYQFDAAAGPQMAFGLGARQCYGKKMAKLEFRIVLILILWNFELLSCPPSLSSYHASIVMTHKPKACYVRLREL